jgi:hypothetical protein
VSLDTFIEDWCVSSLDNLKGSVGLTFPDDSGMRVSIPLTSPLDLPLSLFLLSRSRRSSHNFPLSVKFVTKRIVYYKLIK